MKKYLSMAVLALAGAMMSGCGNEDDFANDSKQQPANVNNVVTLTTTVGLGEGATNRAMGEGATNRAMGEGATNRALAAGGVKTFAAGERMAIVYKNTAGETVKAVSAALTDGDITTTDDEATNKKSATFTFTLTDPDREVPVRYIYPAAMAKETIATDATIDDAGTVDYSKLDSQSNGTLASISRSLDLATYDGSWVDGKLPGGTLDNQLAILAITLKDDATGDEITDDITGMTVSDGTNTYTVSREEAVEAGTAAGPIYVAIRPTTSQNIEVTATDGTNEYVKTLTAKTYEASNGYNVTWNMTKLTKVTWNSTNVFKEDNQNDALSKWHPDPLTYEGITISFNGSGASSFRPYSVGEEHNADLVCFGGDGDSFTFTAPSGKKFTKIEIISNMSVTFTAYGDWTQPAYTKIVWSGTPANEVTLGGSNSTFADDLNSIVFTLKDE